MCRFCEAIGPICRYITDPHWSDGTYDRVPHHPPPPDDLLTELDQTTSSQPSGLNGHVRARTARPKVPQRRKRLLKTGASRPKPAVFPVRLRWPALASGTHRRLRSVCQLHKVPEVLTSPGSRLSPAYRMMPRSSATRSWSPTSTGTSDASADPDYNEAAGEMKWLVLLPGKWNKQVQYAWRFDPCELRPPGTPCPPPRAPRFEARAPDDEFLDETVPHVPRAARK
jgi:hypothetical protein